MDVKDFWRAENAFAGHIAQPFAEQPSGSVVGLFGGICIEEVGIDISARPQNKYGRHPIETLCWNGHMLKAQSLDLLCRVYRQNGRQEYVAAIEQMLAEDK